MTKTWAIFAAIGTPLREDDTLHVEGLERHLDDQWAGGMTGVLVGGTMGLLPLQSERTIADLVEHAVRHSTGRGELMVGAGDTSLTRTRDRIRLLNQYALDGVVVLAPYFWKLTQRELVTYFNRLADASKNPLYLYDLPVLTGTKLELETVLALAEHPNIRGIKCSAELGWTRTLADAAPADFRVIFAQADVVDVLIRHGVREHIDGIFSIAPAWTASIAHAAARGEWEQAAARQQRLSELLRVVKRYGVFPSMTALLNARGIPGNFAPAPVEMLSEAARTALLAEPVVRQLVREPVGPPQPRAVGAMGEAGVASGGAHGTANGNGQTSATPIPVGTELR